MCRHLGRSLAGSSDQLDGAARMAARLGVDDAARELRALVTALLAGPMALKREDDR